MPYFSIIIATYNCENHIKNTIESIMRQTFSDYELIIVEDGSTDNTMSILEKYSEQENVTVIEQENSGPGPARNAGIEIAKGKYLYICDADDILEENLLQEFFEATQTDCDIAVCGYNMIKKGKKKDTIRVFNADPISALTHKTFLTLLPDLMNRGLMYVTWNKVYKHSVVSDNNIRFTGFKSAEDRLFNLAVFEKVNVFSFIDKPLYNYYLRGNEGLATKFLPDKLESLEAFFEEVTALFQDGKMFDSKTNSTFSYIFIKGVVSVLVSTQSDSCTLTKEEKNEYIKKVLNSEVLKTALKNSKTKNIVKLKIKFVLWTKAVWLNKFLAKVICFTNDNLNEIFMRIKHEK